MNMFQGQITQSTVKMAAINTFSRIASRCVQRHLARCGTCTVSRSAVTLQTTQLTRFFSTGITPRSTSRASLPLEAVQPRHKAKAALRWILSNLEKRNTYCGSRLLAAQVQKPAPDFQGTAVVDGQFKDIKLSDFKGKYLVLFFYPLDFTFVCPTELIAFSDSIQKFKAVNTDVVGVSTDSHFSHLAWINTPRKQGGLGGLNYPLLADYNKNISQDYGVLIEDAGIALRGLFIIDPEGVVRQITVNDLPVGRSVEETLRLIQAFQFVEKHGEVCPANWKPESPTIKPNPTDSKEYFEGVN